MWYFSRPFNSRHVSNSNRRNPYLVLGIMIFILSLMGRLMITLRAVPVLTHIYVEGVVLLPLY
jgi:hypothetical protein